jgi:Arylsulfotransferase (ASST)
MRAIPALRHFSLVLVLLLVAEQSPAQASPGHRLLGGLASTNTHLVDPAGTIVHTWPSTYLPGAAVYLDQDGTLLRCIKTMGAPTNGGTGGGVQRLALDGTVLWDFRYDGPVHWLHHDIELLPNGNVLMIAYDYKTMAQAIAAGRNPALFTANLFAPDAVIEVQPTGPTTGNIVWEWRMWDHFIQDFDPTKANYGVVAAHPELLNINYPAVAGQANDYNHMNSVKYDAVYDRIILSSFFQGEIYVIDHSTTTAQAAGHTGGIWGKGGDILYRFGNPEAYGAGTPADRIFYNQHSARVIPPGYPGAGNYTVFNNNPPPAGSPSVIWEFTPPLDGLGNFILTPGSAYGPASPVWTYSAPGFYSQFVSSSERLPNGNTLICSGFQNGWTFEVNPASQIVATYTLGINAFHANYVERRLWADKTSISGAAGGSVTFDVIAGTALAGAGYILLASASGTTPGIPVDGYVVPLNYDGVTDYTLMNANTSLLVNTAGVLNSLGRATATLQLPPGLIGAPVKADFAAAFVDLATIHVVGTTNAVSLTVVP